MLRIIEAVQSRWIIGENVRGFVNEPLGLQRSLFDLETIGYQAVPFVIPACAVDAPHRRDRVWIVAHADSDSEPDGTVNERTRSRELVGNTKRSRFSGVNRRGSGKEPENRCEDVADANSIGPQPSGAKQQATGLVGESEDVADAIDTGSQRRISGWQGTVRQSEHGHARCSGAAHRQPAKDWWAVEPDVGRVATGVPNRVDRFKALGNAVVPQVVEQIGKAIIEAER